MATKTIRTTFKLRRGQSSVFYTNNPVLAEGEPGFELDTGKLKIGNGVTHWRDLDYISLNFEQIEEGLEQGTIELPIATTTQTGGVISSNENNKIAVNSSGEMSLNYITLDKLENSANNITVIFDGGEA